MEQNKFNIGQKVIVKGFYVKHQIVSFKEKDGVMHYTLDNGWCVPESSLVV